MHREEYAAALVLLKKGRYPIFAGSGDCEIQTAKALEFAGKIKRDNFKRPAFQGEFAKIVPGWRELK